MTHLITIDEFNKLARPSSQHIDPLRVLTCIDESERLDIMPTFGDTFYLDIAEHLGSDDAESVPYSVLLNGGVYTDICGRSHVLAGLKKALAYYAYARLVRIADNELTRYGFVAKADDYSDRVSEKGKAAAVADARIVADGYMRECLRFLDCKRDFFPLYRRGSMFKYGRTRYNIIGE